MRGGLRTGGVTSWRLLLAAAGSGLLALVILLAGVNAAVPAGTGITTPISQLLALLAMPLTWRRIALLVAALAGFALLFSVPGLRTFYKLELPYGAIGSTLLIAALGAAALAGFWIHARRLGRGPAEAARE